MHFLDSMFSAPVHGQSVTRSTSRICLQVARYTNVEIPRFVYPLLTTRFQGFRARWAVVLLPRTAIQDSTVARYRARQRCWLSPLSIAGTTDSTVDKGSEWILSVARHRDPIVDKGSEWILSVARHREQMADPVSMLRNAETC